MITIKKYSLACALILLLSQASAQNAVVEENCFETDDGLEVCIKQKDSTKSDVFTQQDANKLVQSLPKLDSKQLAILQLLLQNQKGQKLSSQDIQTLSDSIPKLPDNYINALSLYLQSSQSGTANPQEIEAVLTENFNIPSQYHSSLQAGLKLLTEKDPSEVDMVNLVTQLMKANDVPDEFGNTLQSYFTMINDDNSKSSEDQFMKAGMGLLKFIIKESKDDKKETSTEPTTPAQQ